MFPLQRMIQLAGSRRCGMHRLQASSLFGILIVSSTFYPFSRDMQIKIVQFSWVFRGPKFVRHAFGHFNISPTLRDE